MINDIQTKQTISQTDVDQMARSVAGSFQINSYHTFGTVNFKFIENSNKPPNWFNSRCRAARKKFHNAKFLYKLRQSFENKQRLKLSSKNYKKTLSTEQNLYKLSKLKQFRKLKKSDPRKFWKFLNGKMQTSTGVSAEACYEYYKTENDIPIDENITEMHFNDVGIDTTHINEEINGPILWSEIEKAILKLKNNKSSGPDMILNEHIKSTYRLPAMREIIIKLFNIVFDTGLIPADWSVGNIIPIYKQKGDVTDPVNYRPITLLSCMGKLFTCIINNRLQTYSEKYEKLSQCQAGFRKGFSTTDHIFVLHILLNLLNYKRKKLFCGFIDLKRAFDTVWRDGLFYKMNLFNINGKCYTLIENMYKSIKSYVTVNGESSSTFPYNIGVRQGENLSPMLFAIYLNDLENFFCQSVIVNGVTCVSENVINDAYIFLKLFVLLCADDTVILAESAQDLQNALNVYNLYCQNWKLSINKSKTKVLIFSKGRRPNHSFKIGDDEIEIVSDYKYLGVLFGRSGSFLSAKKYIASQATRAVYSLLKKARSLLLPIDMQIEMFEKTIKPILLYGCEIWGYGNIDILEQVQLKFLKLVLNLKKSTPTCMVLGETGVLPLKVDIQCRIISFWSKLICPVTNNLSSNLYLIAKSYFENSNSQYFQWFDNVRNILISCGFSGFWDTQMFPNRNWLIKSTKQKLTDLYLNEWKNEIETNTSCIIYRMFKSKFEFEKYLTKTPAKLGNFLLRFRTRNHKLPIEVGRWRRIPRENRKCHLCNLDIGDEYHYLLVCEKIKKC